MNLKLTQNFLTDSHKLKQEEQTVSPVEDESSREVFGLIKKLNIAPESRKKPKGSCKKIT